MAAAEAMDIDASHEQHTAVKDENVYSKLDNFTIDKKIGCGQFSVVYRARCQVDETVVALKKVQVLVNLCTVCNCTAFNFLAE